MQEKMIVANRHIQEGLELRETLYAAECKLPVHAHEEARFVVVLHGTFNETSRKSTHTCHPTTLVFRPAGEKHSNLFGSDPSSCINIALGQMWLDRFRELSGQWNNSLYCDGQQIPKLAFRLKRELEFRDQSTPLAIEAFVLEMGVFAQRSWNEHREFRSLPWMKKTLDLLHSQYLERLTIKQIASEVDMHPVYVIRAFRKQHGCTPADYVRQMRIRHAMHLLATTDRSLADIALHTGFCDQSHFSRAFKSLTRTSPARFRRKNRV